MITAQDQQSRAELLPCPFCGSPNVTLEHVGSTAYEAFCEFCGASGPCDSEQWRAAKGWNARALPAGMEPVAEIFAGGLFWVNPGPDAEPVTGDHDLYTAAQVLTTGSVPPGWQAVPVEPTEEQLAAVRQKPHPANPNGWDVNHRRIYREMLAAAPRPPAALELTPLTDERIRKLDDETHFHESHEWPVRFARAIEAAHGIK